MSKTQDTALRGLCAWRVSVSDTLQRMRRWLPWILGAIAIAALVIVGLNQAPESKTPSGPKVSKISAQELHAKLDGAPPQLAALHAQANDLLPGARKALQARVRGLRGELGRQDDAPRAQPAGSGVGLDEQRGGQPAPAVGGGHHHAPELDLRALGQQAAGGDDDASVDGDEVQRLVVAPVALVLEAHALLDAEDVVAQRQGGVDLGLVARGPDVDHDAA